MEKKAGERKENHLKTTPRPQILYKVSCGVLHFIKVGKIPEIQLYSVSFLIAAKRGQNPRAQVEQQYVQEYMSRVDGK